MEKNYKNISLLKLKDDISRLNDESLGLYFDNELSMASFHNENGYSIIIEFFNHLKHEYNVSISKNKQQAMAFHETLQKVFSWFLPFLNPYHQIIAQSNLCILADDEQDSEFYTKYFEDNLKQANRLIEKIKRQMPDTIDEYEKESLCQALDAIGHLNIREHNYNNAILCLRWCISLFNLNVDNPASHELFELYIGKIVRLANCYEYMDESINAIKCILNLDNLETSDLEDKWKMAVDKNAEQIRAKIVDYYNLPDNKINNKNATINIVEEVFGLLFEPSKGIRHFNVFILNRNRGPLSETLKSYIHVLAHCISEYVAKIRETHYSHPFCSTLQIVSRFFLDWLVISCQEETLVTCQATVRAENDACPEALKLLLKRHTTLESKLENCSIEEQNELQEIEFFLFYFSEQELRYNYKDKNLEEIFNKYGNNFFESASKKAKTGDYDSLFHYYVIKFKYLFKQRMDQFINANDNDKPSTQEVENVFLEMCRCRKQCSDQIFKGLIDECERLEELFVLFQQLQWLNDKEVSSVKVRLFNQFWKLYDKTDKTVTIRDSVLKLHEEIIKRNKILILAPIKNAPSCSSEYDSIHSLIELPMCYSDSSRVDGTQFVRALKKIERDRQQTAQYSLNSGSEYSNLKWAVYYPNEGSFVYLYMKNGAEIEYREVIPVYLDKEYRSILEILKKIDDDISDEFDFSVSDNNACSDFESISECLYCNTFLLTPNDDCNLKKLIIELLTFLEFDFYAARQVGNLAKEHILINYPKRKGPLPHDFWMLAFDKKLPVIEEEKGLCNICRNCFVELSQAQLIIKEIKESIIEPVTISCQVYSLDVLKKKRDEIFKQIDNIGRINAEQKELVKSGESIENETAQISGLRQLCIRLNSCLEGHCDKSGEQECETCRLLNEYCFV